MRTRVTAALVAVLAVAASAAGLDVSAGARSGNPASAGTTSASIISTASSGGRGDHRTSVESAIDTLYRYNRPELDVRSASTVSDRSATSRADLTATDRNDAVSVRRGGQLSAGSQTAIFVGMSAVILLLLVAIRVLPRARRGGRGASPGAGRVPPLGPTTQALAAQASQALVETDDAVRTSEQELGFATARFGEHAAEPFSAAVRAARADLAAAFRLRQLLDDDTREDEATRRSYLTQISEHCARANQALDEQSEAFDQLQDLAARAPELAAEVDAHVAQLRARLATTRQILAKLEGRYTPDAVAAVAANPDQAAGRLDFATAVLARARQRLAVRQPAEAAVLLQAAESSADQATDLLDAVEHAEAELTQAASALPAALREIDAEIDDATDLLTGRSDNGHTGQPGDSHDGRPDDGRAALIARAQAAAADVRAQQAAGRFDSLAALRDVQQADSALDHMLASRRDDRGRRERARAVLDQAMLVARSSVTAAGDFITTRRGGVGAEARTRLAEAQRRFQDAIGAAQTDPEVAVTEAQSADALASQARSAAEADVGNLGHPQTSSAGNGGSVAGLGSALLGGIVISSLPGGGDPAELRDPGELRVLGPASFGGRLTRGRRGASSSFAAAGSDVSSNRRRLHV